MKPDLYTKAVLTVIAVCLVWICVNGITPIAWAQAQTAPPVRPTPVVVVDERGVPVSTVQGLRVNVGSQSIPVTVMNPTSTVAISNPSLPVTLTSIERRGSWQPIQVDVLKTPPTLMPTP